MFDDGKRQINRVKAWAEARRRIFEGPPLIFSNPDPKDTIQRMYMDSIGFEHADFTEQSTAQKAPTRLTVEDVLRAKASLDRNDPPIQISWHLGHDVWWRLKIETPPTAVNDVNQATQGFFKLYGMPIYEDPALPDRCFEMRDQDGNVLHKFVI